MALGASFEGALAAAQAGAEWGFSPLYRELTPRLRRYFAARVPLDADDLVSETWMHAAERIGTFEGGEHQFAAWMFTIAHRRLVEHWRRTARRPPSGVAAPSGAEGEAGAEGVHPIERSGDDPETQVVEALSAQEAVRAIAEALTPDQAEVLLLRILGDLTVDEVAAVVGKRPGAVRALQHKALRRLARGNFGVGGNAERPQRD